MVCLSEIQSPNALRTSIFRQVCGALLSVHFCIDVSSCRLYFFCVYTCVCVGAFASQPLSMGMAYMFVRIAWVPFVLEFLFEAVMNSHFTV